MKTPPSMRKEGKEFCIRCRGTGVITPSDYSLINVMCKSCSGIGIVKWIDNLVDRIR